MPVQINTTITRRNLTDVDAMVQLLQTLDIVLWSVFFLVPTGRGQMSDLPTDEQFEKVFQKLYAASQRVSFDIKTTEAQHYRRYLLQQQAQARRESGVRESAGRRLDPAALPGDGIARAPRGLNDGKGFLFVSHTGEVYPSGFLPLAAGDIREEPLAQIYRYSPLFVALRDSDQLGGKCGECEFRQICGGSRARAFAVTGDPFAEDPCCVYQPGPPAKGANAAVPHAH